MGKNGETIFSQLIRVIKLLQINFFPFFHNKIDNIRTGLCAMVDEPLVEIPDQSFNGVPLNCFSSVTLQEIRHIQWCSGGGATGAIAPVPVFQGGASLQFLVHLFLVNFAYILKKLSFDLDYYW